MKKYIGLNVSPGLEIGHVCLFNAPSFTKKAKIKKDEVRNELLLFEQALEYTRSELIELKNKVDQKLGPKEAEIFEVQRLMTKDPYFLNQIDHKVSKEYKNIGWAIEETLEAALKTLESMDDPHFRERVNDLRDVANRIIDHLNENKRQCVLDDYDEIVIAAENLYPSQTVNLKSDRIRGIVTEHGGTTSHAAILARSIGVPLVTGINDLVKKIKMGQLVIVNGYRGEIIVNPTDTEISNYRNLKKTIIRRQKKQKQIATLASVTRDKERIHLFANIGSVDDLEHAIAAGAEGIGLYRTEIYFMNRQEMASEDEQYQEYKKIVTAFDSKPVVVRTLDLGGDKFFPGFKLKKELNPYLGSRSIRLSLKYIDIFKTQIKAILRAAVHGQVKILFPMISNVEEIYRIKKVFNAAKRELEQNKVKFNPDVPFGIMIEVPAAAINIHAFLKLVDFISVGTNDLIQYTLAVDRNNEDISYLYQPFDPAILQLLKTIGMAAQQAGKSAAVCGEIAGDPLFTELLVGFGFRELSMSPPFIPHVKMRVRSLTLKNAMQSVNTIENFSRSSGIRDYVENRVIKSSFAGSEYP